MFKTLILKEIRETLHNFRFLIATLLCLVLVPLGMYVTLKDYEQRLADYQSAMQLYQERSEGRIRYNFPAEGYRPPSILSVFSIGLGDFLPNKVVTSRNGQFQIESKIVYKNPQSILFGKIDFLFNVSFVLSLLALIFTFSSISGEKEMGTLRLIISNSIPRWKILLAKILGNYLVFLAPFMVSLLIGLLILNSSRLFTLFSGNIIIALLIILFVTLLFMFSIFNLGMLVSTLNRHSITSIVALLFIWVIFVLAIPKISPMIAQILHPVKSQQVIDTEKQIVRENLERELNRRERELFEKILAKHSIEINDFYDRSPSDKDSDKYDLATAEYDETKTSIQQEYNQRINNEITRIENDYNNNLNIQTAIAVNLSRISPISCFIYILSEISGTGIVEMNNFRENAKRFQNKVKQEIYDNFIHEKYGVTDGRDRTRIYPADGFDTRKVPIPHMSNYMHITLEDALRAEWVDIVLLSLFSILFFAASFVSFIRYDVR